ncbi:uncharacterized protein LOC124811004 isoform X2 [Hydra vulgaris]|uniref:uncharacterized protein LOC124811004 isoform X2 n=1 Tax=Hydra vulgaris TaxID=6087 RepID=UPI001F5ED937|nr:uncharacterized protein LOC124811004 isoform X2 [Hydra vulgaris]
MEEEGVCNEFDDLKVKKLPQEVLNTLAHEIPNDWKKLARRLDISDEKIDCVLSEFNTAFEQTYQILNSWIRTYPNKVWIDIKNGLVYCKRNDVIDKCERNEVLKVLSKSTVEKHLKGSLRLLHY